MHPKIIHQSRSEQVQSKSADSLHHNIIHHSRSEEVHLSLNNRTKES
jgi:hypothetical protein